jgi:hypothetical protein
MPKYWEEKEVKLKVSDLHLPFSYTENVLGDIIEVSRYSLSLHGTHCCRLYYPHFPIRLPAISLLQAAESINGMY